MNVHPHRRARSRALALCLALAAWTLPAGAGDAPEAGYEVTAIPGWVVPIAPGTPSSESDAIGGRRHLLIDRQYRDDGERVASHHHYVTEVAGQVGVSDSSNFSIAFDPAYQRLELHTARVRRDDRESDRLADARVSVARTETESHRRLLHGEMTALVVLPDVRVGDRVEFRYTLYGRNPVFGKRHHSTWRVRWGVPVARSHLRVSVPAAQTLDRTARPEARFRETREGELRTLEWRWEHLTSSTAERGAPRWHANPDLLELSAYRSWREVADWGATLFAGHAAEGEDYAELVATLRRRADEEGLERAIAAAIDHVQRRIRYYGVELGENSHRPHAPDEVLANGYGDCKDKALLLASLLGELGVDAWPMLVSAGTGRGVLERIPGPNAFDHAIVLVEHDGERHWVDATDDSQRGLLGHRGQPEYGAALVLGRAGDPLITRDAPTPARPGSTTHDRFYLSAMGGPADLVTTTTYAGREANRLRHRLDRDGRRRLETQYLEFYRDLYGELRSLAPLEITRDDEKNTVTVTERYRLKAFWQANARTRVAEFDAYALNVRRWLDERESGRDRRAPIAVAGPLRAVHRIEFHPNVASTERPLEEKRFGIEGFEYRHSEYAIGESLVFESELAISTDALDADRLAEYRAFRERVMRNARSGRYQRQIDRDEAARGAATHTLLGELEGLQR